MLSTKNTNCDSLPELELAHKKQEWCHKVIAKSTFRVWASDFKGFYCQPAPESCQSCTHDMVQMRTPQTLSCSLWGVWERQRASCLLALIQGCVPYTGLSNSALCWTAQDGKSASANPHARPFLNSKLLLGHKQLDSICWHRMQPPQTKLLV